jgi:hypothetical protein
MNWKFVYNSNLNFGKGHSIADVMSIAISAGYRFFTYNGEVYFIHGSNKTFEHTGITTNDLN